MKGDTLAFRIGDVEDHADGWKSVYRVGEFIYFARGQSREIDD